MTSTTPNQRSTRDAPQIHPSDQLLHPIPVARALLGNIGNTKFYEIVASGQLKLVKIGSRSFVTDGELRRYADSLSSEPEAV